jgi:hypothetical protein
VGEDGEQPALGVRLPTVHDREQGDRAGFRCLGGARGRLERLQLAPFGAVHDVPPARAQSLAEGIGANEVLVPPALDALGEQLVGFLLVQWCALRAPCA